MTYNTGNILYKYDNIIKPITDKREYRGIILKNNLKILLISDLSAEKSAAALNVNVGHMSDPDEFLGLAHFCEHMLFLGTNKYPDEDEYQKYISGHGGTHNAWTSTQETVYIFEIGTEYLKGALDRFAQFFIAPLFTQSATEREVNAVNSEHLKNIPDDFRRLHFIKKFLCNSNHPYHKFSTGNKQSLIENPKSKGLDVRKALLQFHSEWYSSNIMSLAIIGKESLDELEVISDELFSQVPNKNIKPPLWIQNPYTEQELGTITKIVPIKNIRSLTISFPFPDLREQYQVGADIYIKNLLGHEGPGSLLSSLKSKGWSSFLAAGVDSEFGFAFFNIIMDLTEEGIYNVEKIVALLFQYIKLLKSKGIQKWMYDECSKIRNLRFKFKNRETPFYNVAHITHNMFLYPFEDVLIGSLKMSLMNLELINNILEDFNPNNIRIYIAAKLLEAECVYTEPLYGIKYCNEKISKDLLEKWCSEDISGDLYLPLPNEFIANDLSLQTLNNVTIYPEIIFKTDFLKVWFKQDSIILIPKLNIKLKLASPFIYFDPLCYNLTSIFSRIFKDSLNEITYDAKLAGLEWNITTIKQYLTLCISGYTEHLNELLRKILCDLKNFSINKNRFDVIRDDYIREIQNFDMEQPYLQAGYYFEMLLSEKAWTKEMLLQTVEHITIENLENFIQQFWSKMHVEVLIHGNCKANQALIISEMIETTLELRYSKYLWSLSLQKLREYKIEAGKEYVFNAEHRYNVNCSTSVIYQCGTENTASNILLELLVQIIKMPCFNILRTKEQLGYIVRCLVRKSNGTKDLRIDIQSEKNPVYLDSRIEHFISEMKNHIKSMTPEEFLQHKDALTLKRQEKPRTLMEWTNKYWLEIISEKYEFNRDAIEVAYLANITKDQLLSFFLEIVETDRRKLAIYVKSIVNSNEALREKEAPLEKSYHIISDITTFKMSKELYPLIKSGT